MNRILLATICGIVLGALIFAMAQSDRFVDAQSLTQSPGQEPLPTLALLPTQRTPLTQFNASAPRSGRAQTGTSRGRNRAAFDTHSDQTSQALTDTQTQAAERLRIDQEHRMLREKQRRQEFYQASRSSQNMRERIERERALLEQRRTRIRARTEQLIRDPSQLLVSTAATAADQLQNATTTDVAQALQLLSDSLTTDAYRPDGSRVTSDLIGASLGSLAGGLGDLGIDSSLAALLNQLGFGDFDFGARGPSALEFATFGNLDIPEFLFPDATVETVWFPVPRDKNSRILSTTRTNDLFVVYPLPTLLTVVESPPRVGIQVHGGSFVQVPGGNNGPTSLSASDERAYDSFLTLNGDSPVFIGGTPLDPDDWGNIIETTWFAVPPGPGSVDPSRFGDNRTYVWVGRFTVKANEGARPVVSGSIKASSLNFLTGKTSEDLLAIDADPALWAPINELAPITPRLRSFQTDASFLDSGDILTLSIDLDIPAPRVGIEIQLQSDNQLIQLPPTATIPFNAIGIDISVPTTFSFDPADVLLTVSTDDQQINRLVRLEGHIRGDTSGDGFVDGADLLLLLGAWGMDEFPIADLNADGTVDGIDLLVLLGDWRPPETEPQPIGLNARWIPVPISGTCSTELEGIRTSDLYIGFDQEPEDKLLIVQSTQDNGLRIQGGSFYQDPSFNGNAKPSDGFLTIAPCLVYDSFLTFGETPPFFTPGNTPDTSWGAALVAEWLAGIFDPDAILVENSPAKFGDNRFYIRIARVSATLGTISLQGTLTILDADKSTDITVEHCDSCWGNFDFNNNSIIDSNDLESLTIAIDTQSTNLIYDLNGDTLVNADDLRLFLLVFDAPE